MDLREMYRAKVNSPVTYLSGAITAAVKTIPVSSRSIRACTSSRIFLLSSSFPFLR